MPRKYKYGLLKKPVKDRVTGKIRYHKLSPGRKRKSKSRVKKSKRKSKSRRKKSKSRVKKSGRKKSKSRRKKSRRKSKAMSTLATSNIQIYPTGFNQCYILTINGKKYSIRVPEKQPKAIKKLCPIKDQKQLRDTEDGVYTYVVLRDESHKLDKMFFTGNNSAQEICSKHGNIVERLARFDKEDKEDEEDEQPRIYSRLLRSGNRQFADKMVYAGEFLKQNGRYYFNFMSGTYAPVEEINKNPELYRRDLRDFLEDNGIPEKDIKIYATLEEFKNFKPEGTFITKGSTKDPFTEEESKAYLKRLRNSGIKFYLFDLEDSETDKWIEGINQYYHGYFKKRIDAAKTDDEKRKWKNKKGNYVCRELMWIRNAELKDDILKKSKQLTEEVMRSI